MKSEILIATGNVNKVSELKAVASLHELNLISPQEACEKYSLGSPPEVQELGDTYRANALLKAQAYHAWSGLPALGDDSGLEVEALANRPGIYSARYGGGVSDMERCVKLLAELESALQQNPNLTRQARFVCSLVLVNGSEEYTAEAVLNGSIIPQPRGQNGFGYDPIFLVDDLGQTLAEIDFATLCQIGFRRQALKGLVALSSARV